MFKALLLFVVLAVTVSASTVTLTNETDAARVMEARGASVVIAVEVPALSTVTVEVGEGVFDLEHFIYAFCAGFTVAAPFAAWGIISKMFKEAA